MNIKLDENLPHQLVQLLTDLGHDVDTVPDEHVAGRDDDVVWATAQTAGRFLVTQISISRTRGSMRPERITGFCSSGCRSPVGARSLSAFRHCSEPRPSRHGRAASSRQLPRRSASGELCDACAAGRPRSRPSFCCFGEDRAVQISVPGPRRCLSAPVRESENRQVRLAPAARTSGCAGSVRSRESSVRLSPSSVPSGHRQRGPLASVRARWRGSAVRRWRLPAALGRDLLLPRRRFRQGRMAGRCRGVPARLPTSGPCRRSRAIAIGPRGTRLAVLRRGYSRRPCTPTRVTVLTEAMEDRPDIGLDSYDRLFPSQDTLPQGGFGNLIALPLQRDRAIRATAFSLTTICTMGGPMGVP